MHTHWHCSVSASQPACLPDCSLPPAAAGRTSAAMVSSGCLQLRKGSCHLCQTPAILAERKLRATSLEICRGRPCSLARLHRRHTYGRFLMRRHSFCCRRASTSLHPACLERLYIYVCVCFHKTTTQVACTGLRRRRTTMARCSTCDRKNITLPTHRETRDPSMNELADM